MLFLNFSAGSDLHKGSEIDFKSNVNFWTFEFCFIFLKNRCGCMEIGF